MLVTSRETKRWVIPKGNPIAGLPLYLAAAREAFEEAGIIGTPADVVIGRFCYDKRRKSGKLRRATVQVYALPVVTQLEHWPESEERQTAWFARDDAAARVDEPELGALIRSFRPCPGDGRDGHG
jgi:8-oxo-dGTP pyrophosphatase MutT (NUDIX family)